MHDHHRYQRQIATCTSVLGGKSSASVRCDVGSMALSENYYLCQESECSPYPIVAPCWQLGYPRTLGLGSNKLQQKCSLVWMEYVRSPA